MQEPPSPDRGLTETAVAQLAREMVMAIRNYKAIFADFGITEEDFYEISKTDYYQRVKNHYTIEWNSTISTADRIRLQGQAGTEVLMPVAIRRALQASEPLTSVIETMKMVAKIAGIGDAKTDPKPSAERFVITINIGEDVKHYNKAIDVSPNDVNLTDVDLPAPAQAGEDGKIEEVPKRKRGRPRKETPAG